MFIFLLPQRWYTSLLIKSSCPSETKKEICYRLQSNLKTEDRNFHRIEIFNNFYMLKIISFFCQVLNFQNFSEDSKIIFSKISNTDLPEYSYDQKKHFAIRRFFQCVANTIFKFLKTKRCPLLTICFNLDSIFDQL